MSLQVESIIRKVAETVSILGEVKCGLVGRRRGNKEFADMSYLMRRPTTTESQCYLKTYSELMKSMAAYRMNSCRSNVKNQAKAALERRQEVKLTKLRDGR